MLELTNDFGSPNNLTHTSTNQITFWHLQAFIKMLQVGQEKEFRIDKWNA